MAASRRITLFIGGHEGKVLSWYLDPTGTPTIGYGATWASAVFRAWFMQHFGRKMKRGDTLTESQAVEILAAMIEEEYMPPVVAKFRGRVIHVIEAGTSFVLNAGAGALKWKWAQAVVAGNIKEAARLWRTTATTSKGQRLPGLVRRRDEEATIAEFDRWPEWLSAEAAKPVTEAPSTRLTLEDLRQGQQWLINLGYYDAVADGIMGPRTEAAVRSFQQDHGTLKVDGIMGRATLNALQRAVDLKSGLGKTAGGTGGAVVIGTGDSATGTTDAIIPWLSDALLWGGLALGLVVAVVIAWRYRDEINAILRKL